jgi:hypothetical protein
MLGLRFVDRGSFCTRPLVDLLKKALSDYRYKKESEIRLPWSPANSRLGTYGGRTFTAGASRLWNAMPLEVRRREDRAFHLGIWSMM